jgi:citrate lyase subunit beta / citryl-CoA lyase
MLDVSSLKSWLFVPGDSDRKIARSADAGADALILDLEDSVPAASKAPARTTVAEAIRRMRSAGRSEALFVRVNALATGLTLQDIAETLPAGPDGYVLPKVQGQSDPGIVNDMLKGLRAPETLALLPIATEVPAAIFRLEEIAVGPRVRGLIWGVEDLGAEMAARRTRAPDGRLLAPFELVRSLCLFAAAAAGVSALDSPYVDIADLAGLEREAQEASWAGFTGKLAIHPSQVAVINRAFLPSMAEQDWARAILAIAQETGAAAFRHEGRMVDTPHLAAARRLLARVGGPVA